MQFAGDLLVGEAVGDQLRDLVLALTELVHGAGAAEPAGACDAPAEPAQGVGGVVAVAVGAARGERAVGALELGDRGVRVAGRCDGLSGEHAGAGGVDDRVGPIHPGDYYQTFLLTLCTLLRDQRLAGDSLTADQLDRDTAELRDHLGRPDTLTCQPLLWQAWAVKP